TIPIGIFALSICGIIALLFFNNKFFIKKFGEEKGLEIGRILNDGENYHPYDSVIVVFILKDNARIELDQYSQEVNNQESQIVDFVVNKTGLSVEEIIWDRSTDNYIEHSEDVIRNYKIDN
ncbi:MAG: hypothetical protein KAH91_05810, partial [Thermoplasmatales archaeon]|nr:hypothetical protein [Thermoplasmatales archaeon]